MASWSDLLFPLFVAAVLLYLPGGLITAAAHLPVRVAVAVAVPILGQDEPAGQPFGFASPQVFPLSAAEPRTQPTPSGGPAPNVFAPP